MAILLLEGQRRKKININEYLLSLSPTLYCRYNELAGNIINYGSDGNTGTVSGCTQGQVGQLGPNEAYSYDGVDDVVTFASADIPQTKALTTQRWCYLVKANTLGELNAGIFSRFSASNTAVQFQGGNVIQSVVDLSITDMSITSNAGQVDFLGVWALVFVDYDDANVLGLGRNGRILKATAVNPVTLVPGASVAGNGVVTPPPSDLTLGNRATLASTFDGLIDFVFAGPGLWSPAGSPGDLTIPSRIRSLVF